MLLRVAQPGEELAVARVHVRSWQVAYRQLMPDDYLDRLRPEERAQRYSFGDADAGGPATIVAAEQGVICGFATTAPARDSDALGLGELYALYVDPDRWGRGVGVALLSAARDRLSSLGFRQAILWMLVGNSRAQRFYRTDHWETDGSRRADSVWGATVDEVRWRRHL